jgi:hypothetical protein
LTAAPELDAADADHAACRGSNQRRGADMKTLTSNHRMILMLGAMAASLPAQADWKTYAGTECVVNSGNASRIEYNAFGGICNKDSSVDVNIMCPVVRDLAESGFPHTMRVSGRSGNSGQNLTCILRNMKTAATTSNNGSGMAGFFSHLTSIPRHSTNFRYVWNVYTHISTGIGAHNYGAYVMTCTLPNTNSNDGGPVRSCLYNYSVRED